jgi:hypothetical protein
MFKVRKLIFLLLLILLGFVIGQKYSTQPTVAEKNDTTVKADVIQSKPLAYLAEVKSPKGTIYMLNDRDSIYFHPFETMIAGAKPITIKKDSYPKLFQQGIATSSAFTATSYENPTDKKYFVKLSNNQPDHGGYSETYTLLIDPFSGEIKELKK